MRTPSKYDYPIEILFDLTPGNFDVPLDWTVEQAERFATILAHLEHFESDDDTYLSSHDIPY
jgi:hypothetical protein